MNGCAKHIYLLSTNYDTIVCFAYIHTCIRASCRLFIFWASRSSSSSWGLCFSVCGPAGLCVCVWLVVVCRLLAG